MPSSDYYENHASKLRFPWRLYHEPIVRGLERALREAPGLEVLNVGSGPFLELERLPRSAHRITLCDIDPRAMEAARATFGARLAGTDTLPPTGPLPYPDGRFDLVVSMDVIEHVHETARWLREIARVLRPGGALYLSTPNYGLGSTLPLLEASLLELIARRRGFSRRHIHPSRFDRARLARELRDAGFVDVAVRRAAFGWVLLATARRAGVP